MLLPFSRRHQYLLFTSCHCCCCLSITSVENRGRLVETRSNPFCPFKDSGKGALGFRLPWSVLGLNPVLGLISRLAEWPTFRTWDGAASGQNSCISTASAKVNPPPAGRGRAQAITLMDASLGVQPGRTTPNYFCKGTPGLVRRSRAEQQYLTLNSFTVVSSSSLRSCFCSTCPGIPLFGVWYRLSFNGSGVPVGLWAGQSLLTLTRIW